jgi:hypothetical protein
MLTYYTAYRTNEEICVQAVKSLYDQVDSFYIINNSIYDPSINLSGIDKVHVYTPLDGMCCEQSINIAVRDCVVKGEPYCLWGHFDIIAQPGAVQALIDKYEEVKNTRWGVIYGYYDTFCLFNPVAFEEDNLYGNVNLWSNYFGDTFRYRRMDLLGWQRVVADKCTPLINHLGSQTIRQSSFYGKMNELTFGMYADLYNRLCGGPPGAETNTDTTFGGLYPKK